MTEWYSDYERECSDYEKAYFDYERVTPDRKRDEVDVYSFTCLSKDIEFSNFFTHGTP